MSNPSFLISPMWSKSELDDMKILISSKEASLGKLKLVLDECGKQKLATEGKLRVVEIYMFNTQKLHVLSLHTVESTQDVVEVVGSLSKGSTHELTQFKE